MNSLQTYINHYLEYCQNQKRLDKKTLKAYGIDLRQFAEQLHDIDILEITPLILENYITKL
ncbi:MAG: site-specific integrase [Wujia sp.]